MVQARWHDQSVDDAQDEADGLAAGNQDRHWRREPERIRAGDNNDRDRQQHREDRGRTGEPIPADESRNAEDDR